MLLKTKPIKSKKAVSVIIGYVLLIVFAIILGGITYTWIKTYIPSQQNLECSEGVSVFVKKSVYNDTSFQLKITIKNTGRFSVAGYFIHATNESDQKLATIDLSGYFNKSASSGGMNLSNSVLFFLGTDNTLKSGEEKNHVFDIPSELGTLFNVRITPIRYQEIENRNRFVSCVNSRTEQVIGKDIEVGPSTSCNGVFDSAVEECDGGANCISPGQANECQCIAGYIPDSLGGCEIVIPPTCNGVFDSAVEECDGGASCTNCVCDPGNEPDGTGGCVLSCGDGNLDLGEQCDSGTDCILPGQANECQCPTANHIADGNTPPGCTLIRNGICDAGETCAEEPACLGQQAQCVTGFICDSAGECVSSGTYGIENYCQDLDVGYTSGACVSNNGGCNNQGGELVEGGDIYCTPILGCCKPAL